MVTQYSVKSRYQGVFFWFTSKDWKNCAKSLCTTSMKKPRQSNKTKPQTKQKDSTSLTCFQQHLRFMQKILNCHTLSRSCNTKLWPPPGWQFFFHLGFQTVELCLFYFLTSPPPCPAPAVPSSAMLPCVSGMRPAAPQAAWCKKVQSGRAIIDTVPARYVPYGHTKLGRSCLYSQYRNQYLYVASTSGNEQFFENKFLISWRNVKVGITWHCRKIVRFY